MILVYFNYKLCTELSTFSVDKVFITVVTEFFIFSIISHDTPFGDRMFSSGFRYGVTSDQKNHSTELFLKKSRKCDTYAEIFFIPLIM